MLEHVPSTWPSVTETSDNQHAHTPLTQLPGDTQSASQFCTQADPQGATFGTDSLPRAAGEGPFAAVRGGNLVGPPAKNGSM